METKYTDGPWAIAKIGNDYDQYMVYAETDNRGNNIAHAVEGKANAQLISAGPDLIEACQILVDSINDESNGWAERVSEAADFAERAIAEAVGE